MIAQLLRNSALRIQRLPVWSYCHIRDLMLPYSMELNNSSSLCCLVYGRAQYNEVVLDDFNRY